MRPVYFGDPARPLAGWLHVPADEQVRGTVVLCPPIGLEYANAYRTLRLLAEQLAGHGQLVLRFDYDGTGDSPGVDEDPGRVSAWQGSIRSALAFVAGLSPDVPHQCVGIRFGALLAGTVAAEDRVDLDGLVLWDPFRSGQELLRGLWALARVSGADRLEDGGLDALGFTVTPETRRELAALDVQALEGPLARRLLILQRRRGTTPVSSPATWSDDVAERVVDGQEDLLDVSSVLAVIPHGTLADITTWVAAGSATAGRSLLLDLPEATDLVQDGWRERRGPLGPSRLAAVVTEPRAAPVDARSDGDEPPLTVLFLNPAAEHHVGTGRMWVTLAREWTRHGIRSVRADISGIGDSPTRPGQRDDEVSGPFVQQDLQEIVTAVGASLDRVVMIGISSGGNNGLLAGTLHRLGSVIAVSPNGNITAPPEPGSSPARPPLMRRVDLLLNGLSLSPRAGRLRARIRDRLTAAPALVWDAATMLGLALSPSAVLVNQRSTALVLTGPGDTYRFRRYGHRDFRRAERNPAITFVHNDDLGHPPLVLRQRRWTMQMLTDHVLRTLAAQREAESTAAFR